MGICVEKSIDACADDKFLVDISMVMLWDHGVQYEVHFDPSFNMYQALSECILKFQKVLQWDPKGTIVIVNTRASDQRLVKTRHYMENKHVWDASCAQWKQRWTEDEIELFPAEKEYLDCVLDKLGDAVTEHGWFEVNFLVS